jgi:hypothetical protein
MSPLESFAGVKRDRVLASHIHEQPVSGPTDVTATKKIMNTAIVFAIAGAVAYALWWYTPVGQVQAQQTSQAALIEATKAASDAQTAYTQSATAETQASLAAAKAKKTEFTLAVLKDNPTPTGVNLLAVADHAGGGHRDVKNKKPAEI